jgi:small nuclear ribonucleoprotein
MDNYENPLEMVQKNIGSRLYIRLRNKTEIDGTLVGYDDHLNMMIEQASIKKQEQTQQRKLMYLRGDTVLLIAKR